MAVISGQSKAQYGSDSTPGAVLATAEVPMPTTMILEQTLQPPAGVRLVPTEDVLLLSVSLPAMSTAQRRAAVAFAVEDRIAQSLDEVEVVLGPRLPTGDWLVAVTAQAVLDAIPKGPVLWPDVLLLPVPAAGWAVWAGEHRTLVRLADGTGFGTATAALEAFWQAAGSPEVTLCGGTLPSAIPVARRTALLSASPSAGFDLRSGLARAQGQWMLPGGLRAMLAVMGLTASAHLVLIGLDVWKLHQFADQREAEVRAALNITAESDLNTALTRAMAAHQRADTEGGALVLLVRVFAAISEQSGRVSVQTMDYSAADQSAALTLEAPDLVTLQAVETALDDSGLSVTAGAATSRDGAAEVQMTVQDEGGA